MAAKSVILLDVGGREVRLTSPDKVVFPALGITKREVMEYYLAVAEPMTRVLRDRPTNLKRYPDGVDGEPFFAKRLPKGAPAYIETAKVTFPSGRTADTFCPTEPAAIAWAANMGTLDFHPWPVRRADTDHPDELRIDLDPQPGTDFADAVQVAGVLREVLTEAGLDGRPKTSGGRGLHVFAPIRPEWDFIQVRRAVISIARRVAARIPQKATVAWWKEERGERVFLDFNQAARDRTIASAWSVRGLPRATVSMPLTWTTSRTPSRTTSPCAPSPACSPSAATRTRRGGRSGAAARPPWSGTPRTASARCPTRPSTRRCPTSRCGCSRAAPAPRARTDERSTRVRTGAPPARRAGGTRRCGPAGPWSCDGAPDGVDVPSPAPSTPSPGACRAESVCRQDEGGAGPVTGVATERTTHPGGRRYCTVVACGIPGVKRVVPVGFADRPADPRLRAR
jgi:DNA ligase D-like protein (predicted polymerase)